jgi:hypothetical protein
MNIRQKVTVAALLTGFALASNPAQADVLGFSIALPEIAAVTAEVGKTVAADVTAYLRSAISAPRVTRKHQSPSVTIEELGTAAMETATMETATMETITVVATRLPPQATEALAQNTSRTAQATSPTRL